MHIEINNLSMFTVIGIMLTGMLIGYLIRHKRLPKIQQIITTLIWVLLFLLGIDVGSNPDITQGLHTIGVEAVLISLAAIMGSVLASWLLWYLIYCKNKKKE